MTTDTIFHTHVDAAVDVVVAQPELLLAAAQELEWEAPFEKGSVTDRAIHRVVYDAFTRTGEQLVDIVPTNIRVNGQRVTVELDVIVSDIPAVANKALEAASAENPLTVATLILAHHAPFSGLVGWWVAHVLRQPLPGIDSSVSTVSLFPDMDDEEVQAMVRRRYARYLRQLADRCLGLTHQRRAFGVDTDDAALNLLQGLIYLVIQELIDGLYDDLVAITTAATTFPTTRVLRMLPSHHQLRYDETFVRRFLAAAIEVSTTVTYAPRPMPTRAHRLFAFLVLEMLHTVPRQVAAHFPPGWVQHLEDIWLAEDDITVLYDPARDDSGDDDWFTPYRQAVEPSPATRRERRV